VSALEPTDEMVAAFERFMTDVTPEVGQTRNALAAVLSIVARDRCMEARGHVYHPGARKHVEPSVEDWDWKPPRPSWTEGAPHLPGCPCVHCGIAKPGGTP
jgi:hypothetical protein